MSEPHVVKVYREKLREAKKGLYPPKCCYTCDHFAEHHYCTMFDEKVPKDFAGSIDQCPSWFEEIPF
jgi:hypothetical protein